MFIQPIGGLSVQNRNIKSDASFGGKSNSIKKAAEEAVEQATQKAGDEVGKVTKKSFWDTLADIFGGDGDDAYRPDGPFDAGNQGTW